MKISQGRGCMGNPGGLGVDRPPLNKIKPCCGATGWGRGEIDLPPPPEGFQDSRAALPEALDESRKLLVGGGSFVLDTTLSSTGSGAGGSGVHFRWSRDTKGEGKAAVS